MHGSRKWLLGLIPLVALAACNGEDREESRGESQNSTAVVEAVKTRLSEEARAPVTLRGVQVYSQAAPQLTAICGQVKMNPDQPGAYTLFVALAREDGGQTRVTEQYVANSGPNASRVFVETVSRCYQEGGPPALQRASAPAPLPVVPDTLPLSAQAPVQGKQQATRGQQQAEAAQSSSGAPLRQITLRSNGNLRANPNGGGEVLQVVSQGTGMSVFGEAPGGWLQVGQDQPIGWLHSSLVNRN
ncbi:SH3 domain-containing protein [Acetobacteraceae bacterium H6797]|nr:SH3 domain-containing protein [Acetobacteraceae bacterium H6797]